MRVVQVLGPSTGGTGVYVRALAEYCVSVGDGVRTVVIDVRRRPIAILALRRSLLHTRTDVVHAHGYKASVAVNLALLGVRRGRRPWRVATLHNAVAPSRIESFAVRPTDVVLGASADLVLRAKALGAKEAAFAPVPAPDLPPATRTRAQTRAALGVAEDELLLLSISRLTAQKSVSVLLDAVKLLAPQRIRLVVAGDGPERTQLAARIDAESLPVTLLGQRTDIADLLAAADVFVLASQWEARALAVQEALRAGVPAVVTAVGGLPDLVGDAALLVPWQDPPALADAVRRIAAEPPLREKLAAAGPAQAATWPDTAAALALAREWYFP